MTQTNPLLDAQQNKGNATLVLVALALGVVTVILTGVHIHNIRQQTAEELVTVYVLNRAMSPGDKLKKKDLDERRVSKSSLEGWGKKLILTGQLGNWLDQPVKAHASENSYLTTLLFVPQQGDSMKVTVSEGKRAYALPVNSRTAPTALDINDYIDIQAFITLPGQPPQSMLIMERVRVLQVGDRRVPIEQVKRVTGYSTIMVEVEPQQARDLSTIRRYMNEGRGEYEIVIRNPSDITRDPDLKGGINPKLLKIIHGASD